MERKSLLSLACSIVLACGLVVILVIITAPLASQVSSIQKVIAPLIFVLSMLLVVPRISKRLNRLPDFRRIFGWTLVGLGLEFLVFPFSLLLMVMSSPSLGILLVATAMFAYSLVFGLIAGFMSILMGIFLIKFRHGS